MAIIKQTHQFDRRVVTYVDEQTKAKYRRVVGGFAWPGAKPGFIVVVAEDSDEDPSLKTHHLRVLAEAEDTSMENLFQKCLEFRKFYCAEDICGDPTNDGMMVFLREFNRSLSDKNVPTLSLQRAPQVDSPKSFEFYVHTIKSHLHPDKKTLHFGEHSKVSGYLMELPPEEVKTANASDYPVIAALGYAVSYLDLYQPTPVSPANPDPKKLARSYAVGSIHDKIKQGRSISGGRNILEEIMGE